MTNKELFYFTGKCLTIEEHPGFKEEIIDMIASDSIDWGKFVTFCSNHLILTAIYLKFKSQGIIGYLPEELSEYLKEVYDLNLARNNQILKQLQGITEILNNGNIFPVYLKGSGNLLDGLYSDIGERLMGDIDFLVSEKDFLLAAQLLQNAGYSYSPDHPAYLDAKDRMHFPGLFKKDVPAIVEIHHMPVDLAYRGWFNSEIIDTEKRTVSTLDGCYVLSDKHNIILNFIHGQLHHGGHSSGIISFRDLYDFNLLSKRFEPKLTLPDIQAKQKAIAYFLFAGKAFGQPEKFYPTQNLSFRILSKKHELNLSSPAFYHGYRYVVFFTHQIFVKYIGQIFDSFHSKQVRQSLYRRISNRQWYIDHLHHYTRFLSGGK
jgi:hypothetical protein